MPRRPRDENSMTFRVKIPEGVQPGEDFRAIAGGEVVSVVCPPNKRAGDEVTIKVLKPRCADSPGVLKLKNEDRDEMDAFLVEIPPSVQPGERFSVIIRGQSLSVTCPCGAKSGMRVRVKQPPHEEETTNSSTDSIIRQVDSIDRRTHLFEVELPYYVVPGMPFALLAGGLRVMVNCPTNSFPGQKVRFKLPLSLFQMPSKPPRIVTQRLKYNKDGWARALRIKDEKFQWVRLDQDGGIDGRHLKAGRFDPERSAFCRTLQLVDGLDYRMCDAIFELAPAHEAECDSKVQNGWGETIVTFPDLAKAHIRSFEEKVTWFGHKCRQLRVDWELGHVKINIRRNYLLEDSMDAIMSLSPRDMRKIWRFEFIGEEGIDGGGLAREWFNLVTSESFDPDKGFWLPSEANQMCMTINPLSKLIHSENLVFYRFLGRTMGKALFDGQLVAGHVAQYIYKHILGWPVMFTDLQVYDEGYYSSLINLKQLAESGENVEAILCLDFTTTVELMGAKEVVELIENGANIAVTNENYLEYMEACLRYRLMDRVKPQMKQLLIGFFDVIPEPLLTVFDFQELELLMCGLPSIDLADWMENTQYTGELENIGVEHPTCQWFWEVAYEFDQETKARLLQFVTGTSGVPGRGFGVLQGSNGGLRKFTINGVRPGACFYPRAHTCFNRLDLPLVGTKNDLREKLVVAVTMAATGFELE